MKHFFLCIAIFFSLFSQIKAQLANGSTAPDWTLADINGNNHNLYSYLNQGKAVVLDFSKAWCSNCWNYHKSGAIETFYKNNGPTSANYRATAFFVEIDASTNIACLNGSPSCSSSTMGNWVAGTTHPFIDNAALGSTYQIPGFPWIYLVCPNKSIYTVGKLDAAGLEAAMQSNCATVAVPLTYSVSAIKHNDCFGDSKGSITIAVSGGTTPYKYQWSNGATTLAISGIKAGNYSCTVTDANNTQLKINPIQVTENQKITLTSELKKIQVCGAAGQIKLTATGGVPNFTYIWNNGMTGNSINVGSTGAYSATVTDAKGCKAVQNAIEMTAFTNKAFIAGDSIKKITCAIKSVNLEPAILPNVADYTFKWTDVQNKELATTLNLQNIDKAGVYKFYVKDNQSQCVTYKNFDVSVDTIKPLINFSKTDDLHCNNKTVILNPQIKNASNSQFFWTTKTLVDIIIGADSVFKASFPDTYICIVNNKENSCTAFAEKTVTQWKDPSISLKIAKTIQCFGDKNGQIDVTVKDGKAPFSYAWEKSTATSSSLTDIGAGAYNITATDANNCVATSSIILSEPTKLTMTQTVKNASDVINSGAIDITVNGGKPPYAYLWKKLKTNEEFKTEDLAKITPGDYQVTITDANGCLLVSPIITIKAIIDAKDIANIQSFQVAPNPTIGIINIEAILESATELSIQIIDNQGRIIIPSQKYNSSTIKTQFDLSAFPSGFYYLMVEHEGKVFAKKIILDSY